MSIWLIANRIWIQFSERTNGMLLSVEAASFQFSFHYFPLSHSSVSFDFKELGETQRKMGIWPN